MAITITDNRTLLNAADSVTLWTGTASLNLFTSDPDPVELTSCIGMAVGTTTDDLYFESLTSIDLTDTLVYVWVQPNGTMDTLVNGGTAITLGDGTDYIGFHLIGSDVAGFRHDSGPVAWQCIVLDTSVLPADATTISGVEANLTLTAVTQTGAMFKTLSKALGGSSNCFTDAIRYGNGGITITAGTSGTPGVFLDIAVDDRSTVSETAYGVCRELGAGLFGLQGALVFGDTAGTTATFFADTNITISFEDRNLGTDKYGITVQGNATGSTTFRLGTALGTTGGSNGCTLICPTGVGAHFTATDADLQILEIYDTSISGFDQGLNFSVDATNAANHEIFASSFTGCGQIDPGKILFKNNSISSPTVANGGLLLDEDNTTNWSELSFTSDGTGHAIYCNPTGAGPFTFDLDNFQFTNFAAANGSTGNEMILVNPVTTSANVTFNVQNGGTVPSIMEHASYTGTVTVNNAVTVKVEGVSEGAAVKVLANETAGTITTGDTILETLADSTGTATNASFNYESAFNPSGLDVIVRVRSSGLPLAAIADDNGVFVDETTNANSSTSNDMNMLPVTPVVNQDRYVFGHAEKFDSLKLDVSTIGTGGYTITWEYWNGSVWSSLSGVTDNTSGFSVADQNKVSWTIPGDWATTTINSQGPYYYVRAAYTAGTVTIVPKGRFVSLNVTKYLPFTQNRTITSTGLTISAVWVEDTIATF